LPAEIIQAARGTLDPTELQADDLLDEIRQQRKLAEEARVAAESARKDVESLRRQLADRIEEIEGERIDLLDQTRREAKQELDQLRKGLEDIRADLDQGQVPLEDVAALDRDADQIAQILSEPVPKRQTDLPRPIPSGPIHEGDPVYLRSLGKQGTVLSISGNDVEIQVGNIRVRARKSDLEHAAGSPEPEREVAPQTVVYTPTEVESPGTELDLRGQQVDEALENLGFFLDKAFLARLPFVRIIHGMGTGKLRSAVRNSLQSHPQVEHFEQGKEGEGGDGVTVVSFGE
jgi:DNA mismatch repair protein MutS2